MHISLLINARFVIPIIPRETIYENYSIAVTDDKIVELLPTQEAKEKYRPEHSVDLPHSCVMPGLINLHSHAAMNLLRGRGTDLSLKQWLNEAIWPAETHLISPQFVKDGAFLAGCEMALSGVTCTSDQYFFPESTAAGLRAAGLRCAVSGLVIGFPSAYAKTDAEYLNKAQTLIERFKDDPFVKVTVAPHAPYTVSDETLLACGDISRQYDVPVHIHVSETADEVKESLERYGQRPFERLNRLGLLNRRLIAVHSVHVSDDEITLIAHNNVHVAHCPCSNMKLASGFAPVAKYMKAGINVGIGTDGAASNDKLDLLEETRIASLLCKVVADDPTTGSTFAMLESATINGAKALQWDKSIGSIEKNKYADLIALDLNRVNCMPVQNAAIQILFSSGRDQVSHTWVAGKLIATKKQQSTLTCLNKELTIEKTTLKWQKSI